MQLNGNEVRRLRHRLHLTQRELGLVLGISQPYVSALECGVWVYVRTPTLARLAEALGVPMEEIVCEPPG
ncbi:MAG TPA: helix-turn-helix transcriptional regulator [Candidatus Tectomicrobia bacterium]|nr:helix-turn-helix transcriptional regulator [Candidatus Tectomicrobia bacterium]